MTHGVEVLVELVHERDAGGDVEPDDVVVADLVEELDDGAQAVAVGGHEHTLVVLDARHDLVEPERQRALHRVLQALGARNHRQVEMLSAENPIKHRLQSTEVH